MAGFVSQARRILLTVATTACAVVFCCDGCGVAPRIVDGVNVPQSAFPTVGLIGDSDQGYFYCSGTLIAPHFVLSAAHCAVDSNTGTVNVNPTHGMFKLNGVTYHTVHIYANPSYKGDISLEKEGAVDLSIWELSQDVPNVKPSPLNRMPPTVGQMLTLAGYGEQGTGAKGIDGTFPPDGTLNAGHTPVDIITETFLKWNFRNIPAPNQESNTAPGDSGGPQFVTLPNGDLAVASVTSGGHKANSAFGDVSFNTRIDTSLAWIDSITGGPYTPGNTPPVVQSAMYSPLPALAGLPTTFSVNATDAQNDPLQYHWIFGDGTESVGADAALSHIYSINGTYNATLIVTDGHGGATDEPISVQVGDGITPVSKPLLSFKQRLSLNFKTPARSTFDVTLLNGDFVFSNRNAFVQKFGTASIDTLLGIQKIDHWEGLTTNKIRGIGTLYFDFRRGSVRYTITNTAALSVILAQFGAINADVPPTSITVPVNILINKVLYSGKVVFDYSAKRGVIGTGK